MAMRKKHTTLQLLAVLAVVTVLFLVLLALLLPSFPLYTKVGVVDVKGELAIDGEDNYVYFSSGVRKTIDFVREADADPEVSVILLDINSGGGSIVASKELMRVVRDTEKPVVAYINEVGASGAYLVATGADEIVADADSLTGSIGAVSEIHNYMGLLEKLGLNVTLLASGDYKAMGSPFEELTDEEREMILTIVEDAHAQFRSDVLANRPGLDPTGFDSIADGRLLSGRQAFSHGLIDHIGSRDFALGRAAALGGIEGEPEEKYFFEEEFSFASLLGSMGRSFGEGFMSSTTAKVTLK
ncbi:MAG: signal peptide peptidase SppA [Candidatus Diapherotrites archaeon]|nr:signal peptide peptidase SppA [Candidatus Diapherotrites archaeon]